MIRYECDKCGASLSANDPSRFIVKLEVYAAAGHIDQCDDVDADSHSQLDAVLEQLRTADPDDVEDKTYRCFRFDVCDHCRRGLLQRPLG